MDAAARAAMDDEMDSSGGVDTAKNRFELAIRECEGRSLRRERLSRQRFARFFGNFPSSLIVMEACGSAHFWARSLQAQGHEVWLLPAQYVRAYVRRSKTDAADAAALLEAAPCPDLHAVPVKTVEQQQVQQLHRVREQLRSTRARRINLLRGMLREFGIAVPVGLARGRAAVREALEVADNSLPDLLRPMIAESLQEITGLTAREHSSAEIRHLGRFSKQGDTYLRTRLVHGAHSALCAAAKAHADGRPLDRLRTWALATEQRRGRNKVTPG